MSELRDYKDSLGFPKSGFHEKRFYLFGLDVAFNDFFGTIFISVFFTVIVGSLLYTKMKLNHLKLINKLKFWLLLLVFFLISTFLFGIIIHRLFSVNTELNKLIFGTI